MDENKTNPVDEMVEELKKEQDTLSQVAVVARIMNDVSAQYEKYFKRMWAVLIASIIANLLIVGAFLWYESQWEYETTTTTTTTVEQDTGTGSGNNVYQSGESAQYHESQKDGVNDGETEDNNGNNDNQETQYQK